MDGVLCAQYAMPLLSVIQLLLKVQRLIVQVSDDAPTLIHLKQFVLRTEFFNAAGRSVRCIAVSPEGVGVIAVADQCLPPHRLAQPRHQLSVFLRHPTMLSGHRLMPTFITVPF